MFIVLKALLHQFGVYKHLHMGSCGCGHELMNEKGGHHCRDICILQGVQRVGPLVQHDFLGHEVHGAKGGAQYDGRANEASNEIHAKSFVTGLLLVYHNKNLYQPKQCDCVNHFWSVDSFRFKPGSAVSTVGAFFADSNRRVMPEVPVFIKLGTV